jgi:hypothetical protein
MFNRTVTQEELMEEMATDEDDFDVAMKKVKKLYDIFVDTYNRKPNKIFISDGEELQSFLMWVSSTFGMEYERTQKNNTYLE